MALYSDIKAKFDAITIPTTGPLTFSKDAFAGIPAVTAFFDNVLLAGSLSVTGAAKSSTPQALTLTGTTDLLGYSGLALTWTVTPNNDQVLISLDGTFAATKKITLPVVTWLSVYNIGLKATFSSQFNTVVFSFHVTIQLGEGTGAPEIPIVISKTGDTQWQITMAGDRPVNLPDLNHLTALMSGQATSSFFPQELVSLISGIAVGSVTALFDTTKATVTRFGATITVTNGWTIAPKIQLKPGLTLTLTIDNLTDAANRRTSGLLLGTFSIGSTDLPVFVEGQSGNWLIGLQPGSSITLPSLSDLIGLGNQPDLANALPAGLRTLPGITISDFLVDFNPSAGAVTLLQFSVASAASWTIIPDFFVIQSLSLALTVENVTDSTKRQVSGAVRGAFVLGDLFVQCSVEKAPTDTNWTVTATLIPGETLTLKSISDNLFKGTIAVPAKIPALLFDQITLTVVPATKSFTFLGQSTTPWHLTDKLTVNTFSLTFSRDPSKTTHSIGGALKTSLRIASVDLALSASLNDSPAGGWTFKGQTGKDQTVTFGALVADLSRLFGVQLPAAVSGMTLSNIGLSYNTASKDFSFTCDGSIPVHGKTAAFTLMVDLKHYGSNDYVLAASGRLTVSGLIFDVIFDKDATKMIFVASYQDTTGKDTNVGTLLSEVTTDTTLSDIGRNISFNLKDALFAYERTTSTTTPATNQFLFGLDMGFGINLSGLPLVGKVFPKDQALRLMFEPLLASKDLEQHRPVV